MNKTKKDIRIQNAIVYSTNNKLPDDIRRELIFDSIFELLPVKEPYIDESERRLA